jgi:hypothetical protein
MTQAEIDAEKRGKLEGLRYAASLCEFRRLPMYNASYHAACNDIQIFCLAAVERVEAGEQMESLAIAH